MRRTRFIIRKHKQLRAEKEQTLGAKVTFDPEVEPVIAVTAANDNRSVRPAA